MKLKIFFILILLNLIFFSEYIFAQKPDSLKNKTNDTTHVDSFYSNICLTGLLVGRTFDFTISHPYLKNVSNTPTVNYTTVLPANVGLAFDYKWLSLEYTVGLQTGINQEASWQRSFRTGLTGKRIWAKVFWQEYRGFKNLALDTITTLPNTPQVSNLRNDIYAQMAYVSVMYAFNKKTYSHLASMFQVDRQRKSAGTWAAGISYVRNYIQADSALIQYNYEKKDANLDIKRVGSGFVSLQGGYAHTFVIRAKWFFHFSLFPAISMQNNHIRFVNERFQRFTFVYGFNNEFQSSFGFNNDKFFAGIKIKSLMFIDNLDNDGFYSYNLTQFRFFVGLRLHKKYKLFF
ncbi:MAG: DUF4421 domain-containing protein [Bacteroidetes bacterium]|nr:MAG: DUF4421 domain-containing protein [Bacteroidota bacterium]